MPTSSVVSSREALVNWYRRNRARSSALFDLVNEEAYYARPIALRHPLVFYEGHLPAFSFNTLVKRGLGRPGIDARLEALFARGIDPHESRGQGGAEAAAWPSRSEVRAFADEADRQVLAALADADIDRPGHPLLNRAEAAYAILEHEAMHQETLLYMWHRLPLEQKRRPAADTPVTGEFPGSEDPGLQRTPTPTFGAPGRQPRGTPKPEWITVPAGRATLGTSGADLPFSWDNERGVWAEDVAAFAIERHNVTNEAFLAFVEAGGYQQSRWWRDADWQWLQREGMQHPLFWEREGDAWVWRGMFDRIPLPASWPVYVSQAEARAYAAWRGSRLPTEAEYQRAAYGAPDGRERPFPWGAEPTSPDRGVFDFVTWDPQPAGSHPAGRSAWGIDDLVGNGWEWTGTVFAPFPGFTPIPSYPEYSADFFDGEHYVIKGASPATARELIRPTFRNWFRARYPYVYAAFRCVREVAR